MLALVRCWVGIFELDLPALGRVLVELEVIFSHIEHTSLNKASLGVVHPQARIRSCPYHVPGGIVCGNGCLSIGQPRHPAASDRSGGPLRTVRGGYSDEEGPRQEEHLIGRRVEAGSAQMQLGRSRGVLVVGDPGDISIPARVGYDIFISAAFYINPREASVAFLLDIAANVESICRRVVDHRFERLHGIVRHVQFYAIQLLQLPVLMIGIIKGH